MSRDRNSRDKPGEPGFASRWSRLKREAEAEVEAVEAEAEPAETEADQPPTADERSDERSDEEVLEELGLPDPDTLKSGDDFTAFMAKAVPARIRNRALRKLWVSDPVLANLDLLLDYGEDFTDKAMVIENLQTAYQVGRGYVDKMAGLSEEEAEKPAEKQAEKLAEKPAEKQAGDSAEDPPEDPPEDQAVEQVESSGEAGVDEGGSVDLAEQAAPEEFGVKPVPEENIRVRQRMRFRLAEE